MNQKYDRNLIGYGQSPPDPRWPGGARIAVSFVLNYEEGGERCILHGDESEAFLSEMIGTTPLLMRDGSFYGGIFGGTSKIDIKKVF